MSALKINSFFGQQFDIKTSNKHFKIIVTCFENIHVEIPSSVATTKCEVLLSKCLMKTLNYFASKKK
jgi:hypothetical protein